MPDLDDDELGRGSRHHAAPLAVAQALTTWRRHPEYERALMRSPLAEQLRVVENRIQEMMQEQRVTDPRNLSARSARHSLPQDSSATPVRRYPQRARRPSPAA